MFNCQLKQLKQMTYVQIDDKLTGWLESREGKSRKDSIKKVINKLQELSYGLFPKNLLLIPRKQKPYRYEQYEQVETKYNKDESFLKSKQLPIAALSRRLRPVTTSFQSQVAHELRRQNQLVKSQLGFSATDFQDAGFSQSIQCLKMTNYEMPKPKSYLRQKSRKLRPKRQKRQTSPILRRTVYEAKRIEEFKKKSEQPSLKNLLRENMVKLMSDNLKVRSFSRSSQIH